MCKKNTMGYIKLFRKIQDWDYFDDPNMVAVWVHLLVGANWEDGEWRGVKVPRGSLITSVPKLAVECGLTDKQVRLCIAKFEDEGQIVKERADKMSLITICNFDSYQCQDDEGGKAKGRERDRQRDRQTSSEKAADKEYKETKKQEIQEKTDAANRLYAMYPASVVRADGNKVALRSSKDKEKLVKLLDSHTEEELASTIKSYLASNPGAYTKMLSTFINNLPDYGQASEDGGLFGERPWAVNGELYGMDEVHGNLTQAEFSHLPIEIKRHLITDHGKVRYMNGKLEIPESHD